MVKLLKNTLFSKKVSTFDIFNITLMLIISTTFLIPFMIVIRNSVISKVDIINSGFSIIPKNIMFGSYKYLLIDNNFFFKGLGVSVGVTIVGTLVNLVCTCMMAYGLSKKTLPFRNTITFIVFFTMLFNGGLIPVYLMVTKIGLANSWWALILPKLVMPWYMFIMRNFLGQIPVSLEESAHIDGANHLTILFRIVLPISLPSIATISLFYAVYHWNSWFNAAIYLTDPNKWPIQLVLREIISTLNMDNMSIDDDAIMSDVSKESVRSAAIMVASLPIMCVYPYLQRYFVKGMTVGAVKG